MLISAPVVTTDAVPARIHKHHDSLRHDRGDEQARAESMVDEVFAGLPAEYQSLRRRYAAQRYLSLFRTAVQSDDRLAAKRFYGAAWHLHRAQPLRWSYLRKELLSKLVYERVCLAGG